ncbi:CoA-binding domain-containing protein [Bradyrhizobium japonicum]|uniref:CoA-binding domain-containing protein n=1 Tax=Bradyrhizobium japonicum TaxID=375 RepID=A0A1Y2JFW0_BRAJP|nr:acetate--CoA ligase family protein [Bradyrhizobium japonicum]OSJ26566.1 CoA-binding domain-containing protein [Bradyrhizobium japonicum]
MKAWPQALFAPRRVAVVGASAAPGKMGNLFMRNLTAGAPGQLHEVVAIHPSAREILDCPAYPSLRAVPDPVDLAVIVTSSESVPATIEDCVAAGVPAVVVITGGFAETGEKGRALQDRAHVIAREGGVRLVGPNCFGVINVHAGLNASLGMGLPQTGGVSLITQSGAYGMAAFSRSLEDGIGFAKVLAPGNKVDLDEIDVLDFLGDDPETRVVAMLLESVSDGRRLFEVAARVAAIKPVVVLKTGRGAGAKRAAASHTAALADDSALTLAALRQAGVRVVSDGLTLLDAAFALDRQPQMRGRRVAVITNSGGTGVELADLLEEQGLEVPEFSAGLRSVIHKVLPAHGSDANPVDVTTDWSRFPAMYGDTLEALMHSSEVDAVVPVLLQRSALMPEVTQRLIDVVTKARKSNASMPVHVCWVAPTAGEENRRLLLQAGIPCHSWAARTATNLALTRTQATHPCSPAVSSPLIAAPARVSADGWVAAKDVLPMLEDAGLPLAPWAIVNKAGEAGAAAGRLGFPVVLKAARDDIVHKTESGAVVLGLQDSVGVVAACNDLIARLGPGPFLVQRQVSRGTELLIGGFRDKAFGPVIMVGFGGILVEALADVAMRLAPIPPSEALGMLGELRGRRLLDGYRGSPPIDQNALAELISRVSRWFAAAPWMLEFDANPVIADATGFTIVDARIRGEASRFLGEFEKTTSFLPMSFFA